MYTQIFDSSIADDYQVRHLFEDLCKLADLEGVVDMTPEAIAARTRIPLDLVNRALTILASPDPRSRSPQEEGRRIVLIDSHRDWGWRIVNYEHYRELRDEDARRSYFRDYMRDYRARKKAGGVINSKQMLNDVNLGKPQSTHAEAEAEAEGVRTHTQSYGSTNMAADVEKGECVRVEKENLIPEKTVHYGISPGLLGFKRGLCELFKRSERDPWSCLEENLLVEIFKRPNVVEELRTLHNFQRRLNSKRYFPQKLERLLADWTGTLDRARRAQKSPSLYGD